MTPLRAPFFPKPSTPSVVDGIIERFRAMIETGQLKVGDDLPAERDLAEQFGVGRNTVREAICKLEAYGIVETKNKRGARVVDKSVEAMMNILSFKFENDITTFRDIQKFRTIVEAGLAAEVIAHATPADIAAFRRLNGRMSSTKDTVLFLRLDDAFHRGLAEGIDRGFVWSVLEGIKAHMDRVRFVSFEGATPLLEIILQNRAILQAVIVGTPERAEAAMRRHLCEIFASLPCIAEAYSDFFEPATNGGL
jgi:DNA-binding FadR family transcriptional regulator